MGAGAGVGQAKDYSTLLKARFAYASDGAQWYEVDMHTGKEGDIRMPFLSYILQAYELQGIHELAPRRISDFLQIRYGGTNDAKRVLGSVPQIRGAFIDI